MGTHTSILACEIPWTEDLGRPTVHGVARVGHHLVIKQQQGMCYWKKDNLWYIVAKKLIEFVLVFVEVQFSSVQSLSCVRLFATPWTVAHQASLSVTKSRSLLKLRSIESVMPSNHFILCFPFSSCLQYFPASGSFPVSQFFASGGQSIGVSASASVLPVNIQG